MTSNVHKRLDKLHREITEIGAKGRAFHFIVGDVNEAAEVKLERMKAEGNIATGDEYQLIEVPSAISQLKGSPYIPEGNATDPLADPGLPQPEAVVSMSWGEQRDRDKRWSAHVKTIEASGERYGKPKPTDGVY